MPEFVNNPNLQNFIPPQPDEITPRELSALLAKKTQITLLDVREPHEYDICSIDGAVLIPLGELEQKFEQLTSSAQIVIYCRIGVRSATAAQFLIQKGYETVKNLTGGILRWIDEVDPTLQKY